MKLHIDLKPGPPGFMLNHNDSLLLIGSCFSENIGELLQIHRFKTVINPHGIVFNLLSMAQSLDEIVEGRAADADFILERGGRYYSYLAHSSFHGATREELLEKLNRQNQKALAAMKSAKVLVLTFGSAYYYHHKTLNIAVSNCHKQPQQTFDKKLCEVAEITKALENTLQKIENLNKDLKIIITVSPVKHLRDGVIENSLSKATLLLACNKLVKERSNRYYFPAFELVNDDLRDYRFYKEDLAHPNGQAIAYVWDKFGQTFFDERTMQINKLVEAVNKAQLHQQRGSDPAEKKELELYLEKLENELKKMMPYSG